MRGEGELRDVSGRLRLFGALAILVGLGAAGLGLLQAALPLLARALPELGGAAADPAAALGGAFVWLALGAVLVWLGWGSLGRRRWVRPLMLTRAWTWLLGGVLALPLVPLVVPAALAGAPAGDAAAGLVRAATIVVLVVVALGGVLLPTLFVLVYRDPAVARTCERHDPRPAWTDRCPPRVLGMAVALAACGVVLVPLAARPAVPLFGAVVRGVPGVLLTLATAGASVWAAVLLYRMRPAGWWAVTLLLVALGASAAVTFAVVGPAELWATLGLPPELVPGDGVGAAAGLRAALVGAAVGITVASVVYMLRLRAAFAARG